MKSMPAVKRLANLLFVAAWCVCLLPLSSSAQVDLSYVAAGYGGFMIRGIDSREFSGDSVAAAGDVNGDGLGDLIVGGSGGIPRGESNHCGTAYVVFGKTSTELVEGLDIARGSTEGFVINGLVHQWVFPHSHDFSVSAGGDINGDGLGDLVIATLRSGSNTATAGSIIEWIGGWYVVFGTTNTDPVNLTEGDGGFVVLPPSGHEFRFSTANVAGDVNGDSLDDFVIAIKDSESDEPEYMYVVFGKTDTTSILLADVANGLGGFAIEISQELSFPNPVKVGDLNGDGLADIAVNGQLDECYVVFGKSSTAAVNPLDLAAGNGGFAIRSSAPHSPGVHITGAADVNGDGKADLLVTETWSPQPNVIDATAYVVFGKSDTNAVDLVTVAAGLGGFRIRDNHTPGATHSAVGVGDMNGDGFDDVMVATGIIGIPWAIVFGKASTTPVEIAPQWIGKHGFHVHQNGIGVAYSASAGDINGDGLSDPIIGFPPGFNGNRPAAGHTYVVFGFVPPPPDADADLLPDDVETMTGDFIDASDTGSNPHNFDTDGDGYFDGLEVSLDTDPNDPNDFPTGLGLAASDLLALVLGAAAIRRVAVQGRC